MVNSCHTIGPDLNSKLKWSIFRKINYLTSAREEQANASLENICTVQTVSSEMWIIGSDTTSTFSVCGCKNEMIVHICIRSYQAFYFRNAEISIFSALTRPITCFSVRTRFFYITGCVHNSKWVCVCQVACCDGRSRRLRTSGSSPLTSPTAATSFGNE